MHVSGYVTPRTDILARHAFAAYFPDLTTFSKLKDEVHFRQRIWLSCGSEVNLGCEGCVAKAGLLLPAKASSHRV